MFNLTLVTGPIGCGKSMLVSLIRSLAKSPFKVAAIDSSTCLELSRKYKTPAGRELIKLTQRQANGYLMPEDLVVKSVMETCQWMWDKFKGFDQLLVAGCPRKPGEVALWEGLAIQKRVAFKVVFIECTDSQIRDGINHRAKKGLVRLDDGEEEVHRRLAEYREKTLPMVEMIPSRQLILTNRSKPPAERLRDVISGMDISEETRKIWLRRLDTKTHPIHQEIEHEINPPVEALQVPQPESHHHHHHHHRDGFVRVAYGTRHDTRSSGQCRA